jgi:hypothetical protein
MIGYPAKPQDPAFQPRSPAGLGAGSHSTCQRVVGPAIRDVQPAYERMDFVQGWQIDACLAAGRGRLAYAPAGAQAYRPRRRARNATLAPRPFRTACGAHSKIFPPFSLGAFSHFFNDNDVKDFYDKRQ